MRSDGMLSVTQKAALFLVMTTYSIAWLLLVTKPWPKPEDLPAPPRPGYMNQLPTFEETRNKFGIEDELNNLEKRGMHLTELRADTHSLAEIAQRLDREPCSAEERPRLPQL